MSECQSSKLEKGSGVNEIYNTLVSISKAYAQDKGFAYVIWTDDTFRLAFSHNGNQLSGVWLGIKPFHNQVDLYAYRNISESCANDLQRNFDGIHLNGHAALQIRSDNLIQAKKFVEIVIHYMELHRKTMHA
ncbi:hypothetical protein [Laribacter hongkongensis]|uniref:YokE-like PH domain-containing protein n=1 Tax=Laribacter hongkongensis TaxID=168471 RepID=A0ABD4SWZ9_9NEIS|nr:hypothetical protein [Laribacter hongkongensis]MCG9027106.1 hypothetical protein [Laribacter hongkongensis]